MTPFHLGKGNDGPNVDIEWICTLFISFHTTACICSVMKLAVGGPTFNYDITRAHAHTHAHTPHIYTRARTRTRRRTRTRTRTPRQVDLKMRCIFFRSRRTIPSVESLFADLQEAHRTSGKKCTLQPLKVLFNAHEMHLAIA